MEKYYVLERFALMKTAVISTLDSMMLKRKGIDKNQKNNNIKNARKLYKELESARKRLSDNILNLKLLFCEADMKECGIYADKLYTAVSNFNLLTPDYTKFIGAFKPLLDNIPDNEVTNASVIGRLMNNVRTGYYPTDIEHVKHIKNGIAFPEGKRINAFDPCCGCGVALNVLTSGKISDTYGIEIDEMRGAEAETRLDRVGLGSFFYSRISREVFHLIFLNKRNCPNLLCQDVSQLQHLSFHQSQYHKYLIFCRLSAHLKLHHMHNTDQTHLYVYPPGMQFRSLYALHAQLLSDDLRYEHYSSICL